MFAIAMSSILKLLFITALVNIGLVATQSASELFPGQSDLVTYLPNYTGDYSKIGHYSGYLKADKRTYLYYWFFQSQSANWTADPVVLWLNGGPGGSSLTGAIDALGPICIYENGTVIRNPTKSDKTQKANMLYIETPAYVGFSYQNISYGPADKQFSDSQTAKHNFNAIMNFYEKFPFLENNDFYLSGISYASFYNLPLASFLVKYKYPMNFKGVFIASGVFNCSNLYSALMQQARTFGFIDPFEWTQLTKACCPKAFCSLRECPIYPKMDSCYIEYGHIFHDLEKKYNLYNLYKGSEESPVKCKQQLDDWINNEKVKKALKIRFSETWAEKITSKLPTYNLTYVFDIPVVSEYVRELLENKIRVLILNGNAELITSYIEAKWLVDGLGTEPVLITELKSSTPWVRDGKVVGHKEQYLVNSYWPISPSTELTLVVLYGAGHAVELHQPELAYELFSNFISHADDTLPDPMPEHKDEL